MSDTAHVVAKSDDVCDFCNVHEPQSWTVVTEPFAFGLLLSGGRTYTQRNSSLWGACDACASLIRRGHWKQLKSRVLQRMAEEYDDVPPAKREAVRQAHEDYVTGLHRTIRRHFIMIRPARPTDEVDDTFLDL